MQFFHYLILLLMLANMILLASLIMILRRILPLVGQKTIDVASPDLSFDGDEMGKVEDPEPRHVTAERPSGHFLERLQSLVNANIQNPDYSVNDLARELYVSRSGLFAKVRELTGETPNNLLNNARLDEAARLLKEREKPVSEICFMVGFSSPSYFSKCFEKRFGQTPYLWMHEKKE